MITVTFTEEEFDAEGEQLENYCGEPEKITFRECVDYLQVKYTEPSCFPGVPRWSSEPSYTDPFTGNMQTGSMHPASDAKSQRRWAKAWQAAQG